MIKFVSDGECGRYNSSSVPWDGRKHQLYLCSKFAGIASRNTNKMLGLSSYVYPSFRCVRYTEDEVESNLNYMVLNTVVRFLR